jgi:polyphenol oxidase
MSSAKHGPTPDSSHFCFSFPPLAARGVIHGFMTKTSDSIVSDPGERDRFVRSLGASEMVIMDQEHGNTVHVVEEGARPVAGDGLIMRETGVVGVIKTADCLPVILYQRDGGDGHRPGREAAESKATGQGPVAVVHAGWRGTVKGITEKALRRMIAMGVEPGKIGALIGPGIGPCCYEVQEDVVSEFRKAGFGESIFLRRGSSTFLDLKKANREQIERVGVREIHDTGLCTACLPGLFHSARRDKHGGRQISFVLLLP